MIRVLIADDEDRICKLIIKLIDWEALDMEVIATANNGVETLDLIKKENPDIVITDIRMPGYDGLEMIERAIKINDKLEFIVISGYSEFEYAKRAIDYGVRGYLLKPINKDELTKLLFEIKGIIEKKENYKNIESEYKDYLKNDIGSSKKKLEILENGSKNTIQIENAKEYIELNYMNNIGLDEVGEYVGLNPSYLSSIFKKEVGVSFVEYLAITRIEKSKELLKEADLKIQDISFMVGYNDVKYFSKLFIKHTGLKPKEYRKIFI